MLIQGGITMINKAKIIPSAIETSFYTIKAFSGLYSTWAC